MRRLQVAVVSLAALVTLLPRPACAVDPFDIEVYDGTANQPGAPSVELHANSVASGLRTSVAPELPEGRRIGEALGRGAAKPRGAGA